MRDLLAVIGAAVVIIVAFHFMGVSSEPVQWVIGWLE